MLKICLVEDEEYTLKGVRQKIYDLGCGYEVTGTAYNGVDALDVIREKRPDVVITDIRMPDMDGIALAQSINEHYPAIITVIISGYQDFGYAQTALKLGVKDYLLKPVAADELKACLKKCERIASERRNSAHIADILSDKLPIMRQDADYCLAYLIFGNSAGLSAKNIVHPNGFYVPSQEIERKLARITKCAGNIYCSIGVYSNEKVIIIQTEGAAELAFAQNLMELAQECEEAYQYPATISFRPIDRSAEIDGQILLSRKIALQGILLGNSNVVCEIPANDYSESGTNDFIAYLSLCLRRGQFSSAKERIGRLFARWQETKRAVRAVQNDLIYITNSLKHSLSATDIYEYTVADYIEEIISVSSSYADLANNYCDLLLNLLVPAGDAGRALSPERLVEKIERYLARNISSDVTLNMLCEEMNYSKVYLCRIFKKLKNTSPIDYFIQMKIEKASELLQECPAMSVKDVAESLGFSDSYYFSKVYKRITGLAPSVAKAHAHAGISIPSAERL